MKLQFRARYHPAPKHSPTPTPRMGSDWLKTLHEATLIGSVHLIRFESMKEDICLLEEKNLPHLPGIAIAKGILGSCCLGTRKPRAPASSWQPFWIMEGVTLTMRQKKGIRRGEMESIRASCITSCWKPNLPGGSFTQVSESLLLFKATLAGFFY